MSSSPVYIAYKGETHWLIWNNNPPKGSLLQQDLLMEKYNWANLNYDKVIWPLFRTSDTPFYTKQEWRPPFSKDENRFHLLGTYELGRDVLSSCLIGMQKSMIIAFLSILIACLIGLPLGVAAYFYSFRGIYLNKLSMTLFILSIPMILYLLIVFLELKYFPFSFIFLFFTIMVFIFFIFNRKQEPINRINTDYFLLRWIELVKSLPLLLILLLLLQCTKKPDLLSLTIFIGIFMSVSIAKYSRFITLSESKENYIQSLIVLGYSKTRIIFSHLIPFAFKSIAPLLALSIGSVILLESSISFLGLGLPVEVISLGNMMQTSRNYPSAWWVVLFPGLCIFWLVYSFQSLNSLEYSKEII